MTDENSPLLHLLDEDQEALVHLIFVPFRENGFWPSWQYVEQSMYLKGFDARGVIVNLPSVGSEQGMYGLSYGLTWTSGATGGYYQPSDPVGLTVAGLAQVGAAAHVETFLAILGLACRKLAEFIPDPEKVINLELTSDEVAVHLRTERPDLPVFGSGEMYQVLEHEPPIWTGGRSVTQGGAWRWEITRAIRRYSDVETLDSYLAVIHAAAEERALQVTRMVPLANGARAPSTRTDTGMLIAAPAPLRLPEIPLLGAAIDPELWEYVRPLVEEGRWEQVAREAAAFVETRARD